jgi:hypothetical protein
MLIIQRNYCIYQSSPKPVSEQRCAANAIGFMAENMGL